MRWEEWSALLFIPSEFDKNEALQRFLAAHSSGVIHYTSRVLHTSCLRNKCAANSLVVAAENFKNSNVQRHNGGKGQKQIEQHATEFMGFITDQQIDLSTQFTNT